MSVFQLLFLTTCAALKADTLGRRVALQRMGAAVVAVRTALPASAAQKGAEDAYATQAFDQTAICQRRTMLGACAEVSKEKRTATTSALLPQRVLQAPATEPDSELVRTLLKRTAENRETNDRLVLEKTIANGMAGTYGPLANTAPIMRKDGSFEVVPLRRYDELKDKGNIYKTATGLDAYVATFDPDAPPPPASKLFGLF